MDAAPHVCTTQSVVPNWLNLGGKQRRWTFTVCTHARSPLKTSLRFVEGTICLRLIIVWLRFRVSLLCSLQKGCICWEEGGGGGVMEDLVVLV